MTSPRRWRWLLLAAVALIGAAAALALALPSFLKQQIETRGSALIGRTVHLERAELSWWRLSVTLHGLRVDAAAGDADATPQLSLQRLHADFSARSLWRWAPVLEAFTVDEPRLRLARLERGRLDIDDIVQRVRQGLQAPPDAQSPTEKAPARFALFNLQLRGGSISFEDRPVQRTQVLQGLQAGLPFLSNLPEYIPVEVQPRLAFQLAGAAVDLSGRSLPFSADRASELTLQWQPLALDDWWAYLPSAWGLSPQGGRLGANLTLRFAQPQGQAPVLAIGGLMELQDFAAGGTAPGTRLAVERLAVQLTEVQPLLRQVNLGDVAVQGLSLVLQRGADGSLRGPWPVPAAAASSALARTEISAAPSSGAQDQTPGWAIRVRQLALQGGHVQLIDQGVAPAASWQLQDLTLGVQALQWPAPAPWPLQARARFLGGAGGTAQAAGPGAQIELQGQAGSASAALDWRVVALDLGPFRPYLARWLKPRVQGQATLHGQFNWATGPQPALALTVRQAQIAPLRLLAEGERPARPTLAGWSRLDLQDARVDWQTRRANVGLVRLDQPELHLLRDAAGRVDLPGGWQAAAAPASKPAPDTEPAAASPWRLTLADLQLDRGRVHWHDEQPAQPVTLTTQALQLRLQDLAWPAPLRPLRFSLAAQLAVADGNAPAASLAASGTLGMQPGPANGGEGSDGSRGASAGEAISADADLTLERLPLHAFEPYFRHRLPMRLARGELGWQGRVQVRLPSLGAAEGLALDLQGRAQLAALDLRTPGRAGVLDATTPDDQLLSWSVLQLQPLRVHKQPAQPWRVDIGDVALDDFYARLVVTEQGQLNLRDVRQPEAPATAAAPPVAAAVAAAGPPQPGAAPLQPLQPLQPSQPLQPLQPLQPSQTPAAAVAGAEAAAAPRLALAVGGARLTRGRVDFTDLFIRPNYSAALTDLSGTIGPFASTNPAEPATVDFQGRVAGTGRLQIRGAFNPTTTPLALDIQARTTDLELAPLSPYSGKYAGYAIERGKLSVDLAYQIAADGTLKARNQIVLNQLTFGAAVDSPVATRLPVRLAVALLADRNGVIDLNLPIAGSINDPQFSIWGIVGKILGNLLTKALTAPFSLLGGGSGEDLSHVAFVPGTAQLAEGSEQALARVANALLERPALQLTVSGHADATAEQAAIRAAAVEAHLLAQQRLEGARAGQPVQPQPAVPVDRPPATLDPGTRARLLKQVYTTTPLPDRPKNPLGLLKDLPPAEMQARLEAAVPVSVDTARDLALRRALIVRDGLIARGLPSERLFVGGPKLADGTAAVQPHVELSLTMP